MVTARMAIMFFLGLGWQFAFEQWGTSMTRTNLILPISFTSPFAAVASHEGTDPAINIIVYENLSKLWDNWDRGANKAFYVAIGR